MISKYQYEIQRPATCTYCKATGKDTFDVGTAYLREVVQEWLADQDTSNDTLAPGQQCVLRSVCGL